ncbi:MAG: FG-GAP repeat protein [Planctomycetes bacterium]|nr:FG-GAP repeat protein [Planctomycetota bacterium]
MRSTPVAIALAAFFLAASGAAQTQIFSNEAPNSNAARGTSVAGGYDFDGDGFDDLVVGTPKADTGGKTDNGIVQVISGRTGAVLQQKVGDNSFDQFGSAVAIAGDVDNDGVRDVIAGAPQASNFPFGQTGMARAFSGATGATLFTWYGIAAGDRFGHSVDGGFDTNGDGFGDVIVGAPDGDNGALLGAGYFATLSGANGATLLLRFGVNSLGQLGAAVAGVGDLNGDGQRDFVVGAPGAIGGGLVTAWSGTATNAAPLILWNAFADGVGDEFGCALAGQFDADNDGISDVLVGARSADSVGATDSGFVRALRGATGFPVFTAHGLSASERLGHSVAVIGNIDNLAGREIVASSLASGLVRVFDPGNNELLITLYGVSLTNQFGASVADAGDLNNDGVRDFVVGEPGFDGPGLTNNGRAVVYSGTPWVATYCTAGTSSNGCVPDIDWSGAPRASAAAGFQLVATDLEGQKSGLFFYGFSGRQAVQWGTTSSFLCVKSPTQRGSVLSTAGTAGACNGFFVFDWLAFRAANPTALGGALTAGELVQTQAWYRDPPSPKTTHLTDALEFLVGP